MHKVTACPFLSPPSHLGQAIQAYLFRSKNDVRRCIENGISLRLCKGAYKEPTDIAWQSMDEIRANFLKLACQLLKEGHQPAIATHDENLLVKLLDFIAKKRLSQNPFISKCCTESDGTYRKYLKTKDIG